MCPERIARSYWNFSITRYNVNRNLHLDVSQRKFFDRSDFRVEEYTINMSEIVTKLPEILAKQYNILKQVYGLFFDKIIEGLYEQKAQYDKEIGKIQTKIDSIESKTMKIIKKKTFKRIKWFFKENWVSYLLSALSLLFVSIMPVIPTKILGIAIDDIVMGNVTNSRIYLYIFGNNSTNFVNFLTK